MLLSNLRRSLRLAFTLYSSVLVVRFIVCLDSFWAKLRYCLLAKIYSILHNPARLHSRFFEVSGNIFFAECFRANACSTVLLSLLEDKMHNSDLSQCLVITGRTAFCRVFDNQIRTTFPWNRNE